MEFIEGGRSKVLANLVQTSDNFQEVIHMVKFVSFLSLRPGVDPDEAYKYWREKHTLWAKDKWLPEAKKYTFNRVIYTFGEVDIYGYIELLFDDMESALKAIGRLISAEPDEFLAKWITPPQRTFVQEEEMEL